MIGGNATPEDILEGRSGLVNNELIDGIMPNVGSLVQNINTVNQPINIPEGYHDGTGHVQINPDEQIRLISSNIRESVTILGVTGDIHEGTDTSDATATASDILSGKIGYSKGERLVGSIPSQAAKTVTPGTSSQTAVSAGRYCSGAITVGAIPNQVNGGTWTPSTSAQTLITAPAYLKSDVNVAAVPNQITGGTYYATTSEQTIVTANHYLTSAVKIGAVSQTNLETDNILRGQTVNIYSAKTSGFTNKLWGVSGSSSVLKYTVGTARAATTTKALKLSLISFNLYPVTINPGFTPVFAISIDSTNQCLALRTSKTQWYIVSGTNSVTAASGTDSTNVWDFSSTSVQLPTVVSNGLVTDYIFGY